jgi:MFS family permease
VSDVVGSRFMYMTGTLLQGVFNVASGLSQTGSQLIAFRGLAGLAVSFSLPSATAVITETFPPGQARNVAFACMVRAPYREIHLQKIMLVDSQIRVVANQSDLLWG